MKCAPSCTLLNCGDNADCIVNNHNPFCECVANYYGDPYVKCLPPKSMLFLYHIFEKKFHFSSVLAHVESNPCSPSPCGPFSVCRISANSAVCSCIDGFIGNAPRCRPECVTDNDCSNDKSCVNEKCVDPCPGFCGYNAVCTAIQHRPVCHCLEGYIGDSYTRCIVKAIPVQPDVCYPSPCGSFSECSNVNNAAVCSCLKDYIGTPPNCRPECTTNADCLTTQHCLNEKCKDVCVNICGENAVCEARFHRASCSCIQDHIGDPYTYCVKKQNDISYLEPCESLHCGINANCVSQANSASCKCLPDYVGDPYVKCNPECVLNSDCQYDKACIQRKCRDPCENLCGFNAECFVKDHIPKCMCLTRFEGNPYTACSPIRSSKKTKFGY